MFLTNYSLLDNFFFCFFSIQYFVFSNVFWIILVKNPIYSILFLILTFIGVFFIFVILKLEFLAMLLIIVYLGAVCVLFLFIIMMLNIKVIELKREINFIPFFFCLFAFFFFLIFEFKNDYFFGNNFFFFVKNFNAYFYFFNSYGFFVNTNIENVLMFENLFNVYYNFSFKKSFNIDFLLMPFFNKNINDFFVIYDLNMNSIKYFNLNSIVYSSDLLKDSNSFQFDSMKTLGFLLYTFLAYHFILSSFVLLIAMIGAIFITLEISFKNKQQNLYFQLSKNKSYF